MVEFADYSGPLTAEGIAAVLREGITSGRWGPGEKVPSAPVLARSFGVAKMTAQRALQLLQAEGLVVARVGSGTYVADVLSLQGQGAEQEDLPVDARIYVYGQPLKDLARRVVPMLREVQAAPSLHLNAICPSESAWQLVGPLSEGVLFQGKPPVAAMTLMSELTESDIDDVMLSLRGAPTPPHLEMTLYSFKMSDGAIVNFGSYQRPCERSFSDAQSAGGAQAGSDAVAWFEYSWHIQDHLWQQ